MAGITHYWDGTKLVVTSDSGTSSCDLKGEKGDIGVRGCQGSPGIVTIDPSLSTAGYGADAKAVGEKFTALEDRATSLEERATNLEEKILWQHNYIFKLTENDITYKFRIMFLSWDKTTRNTFQLLYDYLYDNGYNLGVWKMTQGGSQASAESDRLIDTIWGIHVFPSAGVIKIEGTFNGLAKTVELSASSTLTCSGYNIRRVY